MYNNMRSEGRYMSTFQHSPQLGWNLPCKHQSKQKKITKFLPNIHLDINSPTVGVFLASIKANNVPKFLPGQI